MSVKTLGLVIEHFDPCYGGVEKWTYDFALFIKNCWGYTLHIICCTKEYPENEGITFHYFEKHSNKVTRAEHCNRILLDLNLDRVLDMGVGYNFDLLRPGYGSRYAEMEGNIRHKHWAYQWMKRVSWYLLPRYYEFSKLMELQYSQGKRIVAVSDMVKQDLIRYNGVDPECITVMYNGIDTGKFKPSSDQNNVRGRLNGLNGLNRLDLQNKVVFLFVGNDFQRKNLQTVLAAFHLLKRDDCHLLVVGKGKRTEPAVEGITYTGKIDTMLDVYQAADVFLLPSFYDPCSNASLEAMSCGLPVILSPYDGSSSRITHRKEGFVMNNVTDADELKAYMEVFLNVQVRDEMGKNARILAEAYDNTRVYQKWHELFKTG
jgi:UDP-glucose:(heptosyl)LPS alpha-1,3-glucosyltransferase